MHNRSVVMRVSGIPTIEDMEQIRSNLKALLVDNDIPVEQLHEDDIKFFIKDGTQFWMKPKLRKEQRGTMIVRSKDYIFVPEGKTQEHGVFGDKKGLTHCLDQIKVEKVAHPNPRIGGLISYELVH